MSKFDDGSVPGEKMGQEQSGLSLHNAAQHTPQQMEAALKQGDVVGFAKELNSSVFTNMDWHDANKFMLALRKVNAQDPSVPQLELYGITGHPEYGVTDVALVGKDGRRSWVVGAPPVNVHEYSSLDENGLPKTSDRK